MRIRSIEAEPIDGDIRSEVAIVSSLGEHRRGQYVLVRIESDDGSTGLGEASVTSVWSGETQAGTLALIREVLGPLLIGADPFDTEWICKQMERAVFGNSFAKSAIEMALIDLQGRSVGLPAYRLLGGIHPGRDWLRLKFVVGAVEPEVAAQRARSMVESGWRAIKVKVGRHGDPKPDAERLDAVRQAIGPDVWLSVDANGGFTVAQALELVPHLERLKIALFEQPTRRGDHVAMAAVRRRCSVPILADESLFTPADAIELVRHEAADIWSLYPGKHGGIRPTQQIAAIAAAAGIPCTIGSNLERDVATSAMAHVAAATANIDCQRYPGDLIGPLYFTKSIGEPPLEYVQDRLRVPTGPGLGVQVAR